MGVCGGLGLRPTADACATWLEDHKRADEVVSLAVDELEQLGW
jgi:hypothetical protein